MRLVQKIGQLFFTTMSHTIYDTGLYRFVTPYIWKYQTQDILNNYKKNISKNHLEIGVGTGFLIKHSQPQNTVFRLTLMDLNKNCLKKSHDRLSIYNPTLIQQDILKPFQGHENAYDSIGMNYVLHCVDGDIKRKSIVFDHVYASLTHGGVFFGATLLHEGVERSLSSRLLMNILNRLCIFTNKNDRFNDFSEALKQRFSRVDISVQGSAVIWRAVK